MKKNKLNMGKMFLYTLLGIVVLMVLWGIMTVVIDPYFHYHKPLPGFKYIIDNQRYQNDGIVKHFDYDAIITGSSMTENFKTSQLDALFGTQSVKVPYSGGSYKEINELLETAFESKDDIKMVVRGLDYMRFFNHKDDIDYDEDLYPAYLYDRNPLNDAPYIYNKSIFLDGTFRVLTRTRAGLPTTTFDEYSNWSDYYPYGKDAIIGSYYKRDEVERSEMIPITDEDYEMIRENVEQNITDLVAAHPETEFYFFITPYSVLFWDYFRLNGNFEKTLDAEAYIIELLLPYENVHLFSFSDRPEITCNLDNYRDVAHYHESINEQILNSMYEGDGELTKDNYLDYCERVRTLYTEYDYDSLFP